MYILSDELCGKSFKEKLSDVRKKMEAEGVKVLKLNIGNPAPFGCDAPQEILDDMKLNLRDSQGYSTSKGIFPARKAIMQYCQLKNIPNVGINDVYLGLSVVALGLVIWIIVLLIRDPQGKIKAALKRK